MDGKNSEPPWTAVVPHRNEFKNYHTSIIGVFKLMVWFLPWTAKTKPELFFIKFFTIYIKCIKSGFELSKEGYISFQLCLVGNSYTLQH
ncbi:hypothetical protein HMPREF9554_02969 [Treponema phagedenis F0421]|uniref:Uncharacterized protein n=1 Tax=Treponema phagedenis TaxID=162 RepID=A0AAE6M790_TREPH|nr:hypothetical protein HMPREF9554_02969 [Treponema phagedenis F0421]QEJ98446.1 hypothetical protein FUT82_10860 [Treponema phagedenis]TYT77907.1 hypothetical protein FS559_01585 [Treponema phagedenis]